MQGAAVEQYRTGRPCPRCAYVRTPRDTHPDWQCPQCGIAYLKYRPPTAPRNGHIGRISRELAGDARLDRSGMALVAANLLAAGVALAAGVGLHELMLVYWIQSVLIGLSFFVRILALRQFSTEGLTMNDKPVAATASGKRKVAGFFLVHYGIFHLVYLVFLLIEDGPVANTDSASTPWLWLCALGFLVSHLYSLRENIGRDREGRPNLGTLMFLPYARILPMHFTIIFGGTLFGGTAALTLFTLLKTAADVIMHLVEHRVLRGAPLNASPAN